MDDIEETDDMVCVRPSCAVIGGEDMPPLEVEDMVVDRPGGGADPKMLEKAASRWLFGGGGPYRR
jgi:hypothetical protein